MRIRHSLCIGIFLMFVIISPLPVYAGDYHELISVKVGSPPKLDGIGDDEAWKSAKEVEVEAEDGPEINIKSVYTDKEIFFLLSWEDDTESVYDKQCIFDGEKWVYKNEVRFKGDPPRVADSDRIGFQWVVDDSINEFPEKGCKTLCHSPEKEDKMYTTSPKERTDIWLWISAITNPLGYMDDNYLDNTNISIKDEKDKVKRINAAHHGDDPGAGGLNFVLNDAGGKPKWMPKGGVKNINFLMKGEETPLNQSVIKKGDALPGWVLARPKGSRGDIDAAGRYHKLLADELKWVVEIRRRLSTEDKEHDVQFNDLKKVYYFGLAVWDNDSLFRHAKVKKPFGLSFK